MVLNMVVIRYDDNNNSSGGIASSSFILFFTCIGIPIYVVYSVCDSASEFGAMGSTSFFGVFLP